MMSDDLRVVFLSRDHESKLTFAVNNWLDENKVEIVDIKYQAATGGGDNRLRNLYSVMILYKQPK